MLFVVLFLHWTGIRADNAGEGEIVRLREGWASAPAPAGSSPPGTRTGNRSR